MTKMPTTEAEYHEQLAALPEDKRDDYRQLMETLKPWETLHPDLAEWIVDSPFGKSLKHPLVFEVIYAPGMQDGMLNERYEQKRDACACYLAEGNYSGFVWMHERPYRLDALLQVAEEIEDDAEFWELVGSIWVDTENLWQNYDEWHDVLHAERGDRTAMMDDDERAALAALPDEVTIWRGYNADDEDDERHIGFSWSLRRDCAEWFAERFASHRGRARVLCARVRKADVVALFTGRGEDEIVVLPEHLIDIEETA